MTDAVSAAAAPRNVPRGALAFVLATVGINMLGVGLAWPILPLLVEQLGSGGISEAAFAYAWIGALYAIAQFAFAPLMGALSDAYGRRPILLGTQVALAIDYALMVIVPDLAWLAVLRFASGIFAATVSTANAFVADVSTPENRSRNFGFIGAVFGVGFILGPVLGGLLGEVSLRLPFAVACALTVANVAFGWWVLPESLALEQRRPVSLPETNPFGALLRAMRMVSLGPLLTVHALTGLAQRGLEATWVLYTAYRFGWGVREASFSLAFVGVCYFVVQSVMVGPVVSWLGERRTLALGLLLGLVSMLLYAVAVEGWQAYPLIALYCVGNAIAQPALLSLASGSVGPREQGALQGAMTSVGSATIIFGPIIASLILAAVTADRGTFLPAGSWFLVAAMLYLFALLILQRRWSQLGSEGSTSTA